MTIYVNRTLNLKNIRCIGLDMDYTLVRYHPELFERMAFEEMLRKLVDLKGYPTEILSFTFDMKRVVRGLVLDRKRGNLLKLSLYGRVKSCYHGSKGLTYKEMQAIYRGLFIDVSDAKYESIDTSFSLSVGAIFALLVDYKDRLTAEGKVSVANVASGCGVPEYEQISSDIKDVLNLSHVDDSLKGRVKEKLNDFIIHDPEIPRVLEDFKANDKKIILVTNSDYHYTKLLLDHTFNPYLQHHSHWTELFELVVTNAEKPRFFTETRRFLKVDPATGLMTNWEGPLQKGIYQGGCSKLLEKYLQVGGDEILYLGDHIYGDIVALKKACNWRTALVVEELQEEVVAIQKGKSIQLEIDQLMTEKGDLEKILFGCDKESGKQIYQQIRLLDEKVAKLIETYQQFFNPYWGPVMRAGQEESYIAGQIERYACIYMGKISDFKNYSPRHYFRPRRRPLPHEIG